MLSVNKIMIEKSRYDNELLQTEFYNYINNKMYDDAFNLYDNNSIHFNSNSINDIANQFFDNGMIKEAVSICNKFVSSSSNPINLLSIHDYLHWDFGCESNSNNATKNIYVKCADIYLNEYKDYLKAGDLYAVGKEFSKSIDMYLICKNYIKATTLLDKLLSTIIESSWCDEYIYEPEHRPKKYVSQQIKPHHRIQLNHLIELTDMVQYYTKSEGYQTSNKLDTVSIKRYECYKLLGDLAYAQYTQSIVYGDFDAVSIKKAELHETLGDLAFDEYKQFILSSKLNDYCIKRFERTEQFEYEPSYNKYDFEYNPLLRNMSEHCINHYKNAVDCYRICNEYNKAIDVINKINKQKDEIKAEIKHKKDKSNSDALTVLLNISALGIVGVMVYMLM